MRVSVRVKVRFKLKFKGLELRMMGVRVKV